MDPGLLVSVAALLIAAVASIVNLRLVRNKTNEDRTEDLERQIAQMQDSLEECRKARERAERQKAELLLEIYELRKKVDRIDRHQRLEGDVA